MSIVRINELTVPPGRREALEDRFDAVMGTFESCDGFEWFELLRPTDGADRYLVYTRWSSEADFERWLHGPSGPSTYRSPNGPDAEKPGLVSTAMTFRCFDVQRQAAPARTPLRG
jgi:heme-degrading monooxygenase HmoA